MHQQTQSEFNVYRCFYKYYKDSITINNCCHQILENGRRYTTLKFKFLVHIFFVNPSWPEGKGGKSAPTLEFFCRNFFRQFFFYETNLENYYFYVQHMIANFQKISFQPYFNFLIGGQICHPPPLHPQGFYVIPAAQANQG